MPDSSRACCVFRSLLTLGFLLLPAISMAQQPGAVLAGTVYGVGGAPLAGADIVIVEREERVTTGPDGRFRLTGLPTNRYLLLIRAPGYDPARIVAVLGEAGIANLEIFLNQYPYALDNIVVTGERRGIYGVVLGPDMEPISGSQVRVLGGGASQLSDSVGQFGFPDKHGGTYAVRATKEGFLAKPVFLRVPRGESRQVTIHLAPVPPGYRAPILERAMYEDLATRLAYTSPLGRMNDQELERFEGMRVCDIPKVRAFLSGAERFPSGLVPVTVVNGHQVLRGWPPCDWLASEVALIELDIRCNLDGVVGWRMHGPARPGGTCIALWLK